MKVVEMNSCCHGPLANLGSKSTKSNVERADRNNCQIRYIEIPAGVYMMGSRDLDANPQDAEGPPKPKYLPSFHISNTPVTNCQFADFVSDTNYETQAESQGWSFVFHLLVEEESDVIGHSEGAPWWLGVSGANWKRPFGGRKTFRELPNHPVVHISFHDAKEFCQWHGSALPTEAQWEKAARGGLDSKRFPWGDDLRINGEWQCNIFQGDFPNFNTEEDGFLGTSPVASYPANLFGGYDFSGNVWEWTDSNFFEHSDEGIDSELKVTRGGSYLCHDSHCNRYRVGARNRTAPDTLAGNIGFRVVRENI